MKEKKQIDEKNLHAGHRKRLIGTAIEGDFDSLSDIQKVELFLFYVLPRVDVNPLAHRLLDQFGCFSAILDASIDDLKNVKGLGRESAKKIKNYLNFINFYTESKLSKESKLSTVGDILDYSEELLRPKDYEETHVFSLNNNGFCNASRCIAKGDITSVNIPIKKFFEFIESSKSSSIIIVHNHPDMKAIPSQQDLETYERLKLIITSLGCGVYESYILGTDGIYAMGSQHLVRDFTKTDQVVSKLQVKKKRT